MLRSPTSKKVNKVAARPLQMFNDVNSRDGGRRFPDLASKVARICLRMSRCL